MNEAELIQALEHDASRPPHQDSPVVAPDDLRAACRHAEASLRAATELIAWACQRAFDKENVQLAAVLDARNAELKRAALTLGLITNDAAYL
jgi:hypothetical protein